MVINSFFATSNFACMRSACLLSSRQEGHIASLRTSVSNLPSMAKAYTCQVDAEPLHRYRSGGYHPLQLGDVMGNGRYKILHKLGWGANSTVWAARDQKLNRNVAIKVNTSETSLATRELRILRDIASKSAYRQTSPNVVRLEDDFEVSSPNGTHTCIVTELLGPNIPDILETRAFKDHRLSATWAKSIARQLLQAVCYLHEEGIGHGDLHTRNIVLKDRLWDHLSEVELKSLLGKPKTADIVGDGRPVEANFPRYLVWPSSLSTLIPTSEDPEIRLIDFGEAFSQYDKPETLATPLPLRAPEVIFGDEWDYRVDLWTAGCTIFELVTGQPPFDTVMITKEILIGQMIDAIGELPKRWAAKWKPNKSHEDDEKLSLEEWLVELYFDEEKEAQFTREQIESLARILRMLMRFEPASRESATSVLKESWLA